MPFVERPGARIHYDVAGEGPPVVLAHGFLCSGAMWAAQVEPLARRHRVVNVDARGHGASSHAAAPFTLGDLVDDHLAVLDALGVARAAWVGHSMGGMVALRAALAAPSRVGALALVDSDAGAETLAVRARYAALAMAARTVGIRPLAGAIADLMLGETTLRSRAGLADEFRRGLDATDVPSALRALDALVRREDLGAALRGVAAPALVVVGAEDRALPPERSHRLARALPAARLVEIPGAGHLPSIEQPALVTAALVEFLAAVGWDEPPGRHAAAGG